MRKLILLLLIVCAAPSLRAQGDNWDQHMTAGEQASRSFKIARAEKEFQAALDEARQFPPNDLRTAETLNKLGAMYAREGKLPEAESRWKQSFAILEASAAPDDSRLAYALIGLALIAESESTPEHAATVWPRPLAILNKAGGALDPEALASMESVASSLFLAHKYAQAEQVYQSVLELRDSVTTSPDGLRQALSDLAKVRYAAKDYSAEEPLEIRRLELDDKSVGPYSPVTGRDAESLASVYATEGKFEAALPLWHRALEISEKNNQPDSASARAGKNLATAVDMVLMAPQLPLFMLTEGGMGFMPGIPVHRPDPEEVFRCYKNLAKGYASAGKYPEAESMYTQIVAVEEKKAASDRSYTGLSFSILARDLRDFSRVYCDDRRYDQAVETIKRSEVVDQEIANTKYEQASAKRLGPSAEPWFSEIELADIYRAKGDLAAAEPAYAQSLEMAKDLKLLPGHPVLARLLGNYATVLRDEGKYDQSESLYKHSLETWAKSRYPQCPDVAATLTNYAELLRKLNRPGEAEPLEARASAIRENRGESPPEF